MGLLDFKSDELLFVLNKSIYVALAREYAGFLVSFDVNEELFNKFVNVAPYKVGINRYEFHGVGYDTLNSILSEYKVTKIKKVWY